MHFLYRFPGSTSNLRKIFSSKCWETVSWSRQLLGGGVYYIYFLLPFFHNGSQGGVLCVTSVSYCIICLPICYGTQELDESLVWYKEASHVFVHLGNSCTSVFPWPPFFKITSLTRYKDLFAAIFHHILCQDSQILCFKTCFRVFYWLHHWAQWPQMSGCRNFMEILLGCRSFMDCHD